MKHIWDVQSRGEALLAERCYRLEKDSKGDQILSFYNKQTTLTTGLMTELLNQSEIHHCELICKSHPWPGIVIVLTAGASVETQ